MKDKVTKKQAEEFCRKLGLTNLRKSDKPGVWIADSGDNPDYVIDFHTYWAAKREGDI